jgi:rod shape determining protein RodA
MKPVKRRIALNHPAWAVFVSVSILYVIGILCIYATEVGKSGPPTNTIKQCIYVAAGFVVVGVVMKLGYGWFARYGYTILLIGVVLLVPLVIARYVPIGSLIPSKRGAHRWIALPMFQLQPSEFMKVAYIIGLATYLKYRANYRTLKGLSVPILASLVPMLLILLEPDLGTVLLMIPVLAVMLYAAGARLIHFGLFALIGLVSVPLLWDRIQPYQRSRVLGVLLQSETLRKKIIAEPEKYAFLGTKRQAKEWEVGSGMQLVRSKAALGSGGLTGQGWGHGTYVEYNFLPDKHNDFIFAIVGHQWGLVGCVLVIVCYVIIVLAGIEIASATQDPFARLLAVGVIALIAAQVTINVGMTLGLMPITGMTLPFVSYGGSSLLTNFAAVGLLLSVSGHKPFLLADPPFDFDRRQPLDQPIRPNREFRNDS